VYDRQLIQRCLVEVVRQNASWDCFFHAFGIRPLVVTYESLAADPPRVVREVASFVGIDLAANEPIPGPRTERQRDDDSETWRARFVDEMRQDATWPKDRDVLQRVPVVSDQKRQRWWRRRVEPALRA
jgi:LPS sulfotransferase NodH